MSENNEKTALERIRTAYKNIEKETTKTNKARQLAYAEGLRLMLEMVLTNNYNAGSRLYITPGPDAEIVRY